MRARDKICMSDIQKYKNFNLLLIFIKSIRHKNIKYSKYLKNICDIN